MNKLLSLFLFLSSFSQELPKPFDINSKANVIDYINEHYATYCSTGPAYNNAVVPFNEHGNYATHKYSILSKEDIRDGQLITIKISESSIFAFLIFNVYENESYTSKTFCCYAPIKFGEVVSASYKKLILTKKRLLVDNTYREELVVGGLTFTIENRIDYRKVRIVNSEISLNNYDLMSDASFKSK